MVKARQKGLSGETCDSSTPRSDAPAFEFYERYHKRRRVHPIETLKQMRRIEVLEQLMPMNPRSTLFIGCGQGDEVLLAKGKVFALDVAISALREAQEKQPLALICQADARLLPFAGSAFDCVICSEVIEHIPEAKVVVREINRVTRQGGSVVVSTPNWWSFFGLARAAGELILREPITSGGQPFDRWGSPQYLRSLLSQFFLVKRVAGSWYFPPFGRGDRQAPTFLTVPLVKRLLPIERLLSRVMPWFGHVVVVSAEKPKR